MIYTLRFETRVLKDLDRIPEKDLVRIDKTIQALENLYRVRQGDYRIIYTVDHKAGIVSILGVRNRRDAYR